MEYGQKNFMKSTFTPSWDNKSNNKKKTTANYLTEQLGYANIETREVWQRYVLIRICTKAWWYDVIRMM
jgi:hypothetical protein